MRITVRLDDALLDQAKSAAANRHETLTALIEKGLRLVLAQSRSPRARRKHVVLPIGRQGGGLLPGIDLDKLH
jgi:hydroxymethylpyrimidine pyrophosphatase-like HAD family hydrolase